MRTFDFETGWEKRPTEAQLAYWESMRGKKGKETPRWKGDTAGKTAKHQFISKHFGTPSICESKDCKGKSQWYDWAIKTGRKYSHNRDDYLRLCRSCHRKYDLTPKLKKKAIQNLWWARGIDNPGKSPKN